MKALRIELFSCAGGMAEGFRRAGIEFDLVVDKDPNAVESYATNMGHRPVHMDVHDFLRIVRLGFRPVVELLIADPPCTPWSTAGKKLGLDDKRDCMRVTVEIIRLLRPRTYLIGNVPGLETEPNTRVVQDTIGSLGAEGYCTADFTKLDAANYGVPQNRVRPFWFGHLEGPCLRWPTPTHARTTGTLYIEETDPLLPWVTCRDALGHLPPDEIGRPVRLRVRGGKRAGKKPRASAIDEPAHAVTTRAHSGDGSIVYVPTHQSHADEPARTITRSRGGADVVVEPRDNHPPSTLAAPARCVRTNGGRDSAGGTTLVVSEREPDPNRIPTSPDEPVRSMTRETGRQAWVQWPWKEEPSVMRPRAVVLSEKAAAILQGFPESWVFVGKTKKARWSQIGQAMPPALAEAVARSIMERSRDDACR